jgi:hypothetical protein
MLAKPPAAARAPASPFHPLRLVAALTLAVGLHGAALASPASDIAALKKALAAMKSDYDKRLGALESQLHDTQAELAQAKAANAAPTTAAASANANAVAEAPAPVVPIAPPATVAVDTSVAAPTGAAGGGATAFNPQISLILSGTYAHTSQDPARARITGFALPPGAEIGVGSRGFSLAESELALAANIDPWLAGNINLSITGDDTISAEEAFITTTSLPSGLVLKAGRFFSGLGYLNSQHSHTWDFVDAPVAYQAMLGTQYADDGVQLHWLAPTDQYMEFGLEAGRGRGFPGDNGSRNAAGMAAATFHTGGDIGDSTSWRAGLSYLQASASDQALDDHGSNGAPLVDQFSGRTHVVVADGVLKWAPNGNATRTYFKLQGEYLQSRRSGDLAVAGSAPAGLHQTQSGGYIQGVYQFMPMWRVGLRTERLDPGHADGGANDFALSSTNYHPTKNSIMVDFSQSEFARFRLQFAQDRTRQGFVDNQFLLQYQTALGAHGAHAY